MATFPPNDAYEIIWVRKCPGHLKPGDFFRTIDSSGLFYEGTVERKPYQLGKRYRELAGYWMIHPPQSDKRYVSPLATLEVEVATIQPKYPVPEIRPS